MKTTITIFLVLFSTLTSSYFCQSVNTKEYLKTTNVLWSICNDFKKVKDSEDPEKDRNSIIPILKKNIESAKKESSSLISKQPNDTDIKKLDMWIKVLDKSYVSLTGDKWNSEPTWQLGFVLVEMDLEDFVNNKL